MSAKKNYFIPNKFLSQKNSVQKNIQSQKNSGPKVGHFWYGQQRLYGQTKKVWAEIAEKINKSQNKEILQYYEKVKM